MCRLLAGEGEAPSLIDHNPLVRGEEGEEEVEVSAFGTGWGRDSPVFKTRLSTVLGVVILVAAVAATVLTIQQGTYGLDAQTCATTGQ